MPRQLTISDCQGKVLTKTTNVDNHTCGVSVLPERDGPKLVWPGIDLDVHAAFIGIEDVDRDSEDKDYDVRLLSIDRELLLRAHKGSDHCET